MSRLTEFYRGNDSDIEKRTLAALWAYPDEELESTHDFIQWMFPLREPSGFNVNAPLLTDADITEFRSDPKLRENLLRSSRSFWPSLVSDTRTDVSRRPRISTEKRTSGDTPTTTGCESPAS